MNKFLNLGVTAAVLIGLAGCAPIAEESAPQVVGEATATEAATVTTSSSTTVEQTEGDEVTSEAGEEAVTSDGQLADDSDTVKLLTYLIEEEKLAHDVYTVLYDMYGSKVFGNILQSESQHQDQVMTLLDAYGVADPRLSELGVFQDRELQALYDDLVEMGSRSAADAFQVGVLIEEKDIADISTQLATASDPVVVDVLEKLRAASENHLRAFNRQL